MDFHIQLARKTEKMINSPDSGLFWILIILSLILLALAVNIFGSPAAVVTETSASPTAAPFESQQARVYSVSYKAGVFSPTNLRIKSGDTVRFHNDGLLSIRVVSNPHPEHNDYAGLDSIGDIPPGSYFAFTFAAKGTFGYHNEKNPSETGTVIVR